MKLAIVVPPPNSPIDTVLSPVADYLRANTDWEVDLIQGTAPKGDYDIMHFGWAGLYKQGSLDNEVRDQASAITANLWSMPLKRVNHYVEALLSGEFSRIVVDEPTTFQMLGQLDIPYVEMIPMTFDYSKYEPLPLPDKFTVGCFGDNYASKRFHIIKQACEEAEIPFFAQVFDAGRSIFVADMVADFYRHVSCVVSASFVDTNSLPLMEASLCGRWIVAPPNAGLERIVRPGVNGVFYDGTASGLAKVLPSMAGRKPKNDLASWPSLEHSCLLYKHMFEQVANEHL